MTEDRPEDHAQSLAIALIAAAQREGVRPPRSRLESCAQVIFILRDKQWSFAAITDWLARHGVQVAESTVQRFYRSRCRPADPQRRLRPPNDTRQPDPFFDSNHENLQSPASGIPAQPVSKPKYNTNF